MIGILMEYAEQSTSNAQADLFSNQENECKIRQTLSNIHRHVDVFFSVKTLEVKDKMGNPTYVFVRVLPFFSSLASTQKTKSK